MGGSRLVLQESKGSELGRGLIRARGDGTRAEKTLERAGEFIWDVEHARGAILKFSRVIGWVLKLQRS